MQSVFCIGSIDWLNVGAHAKMDLQMKNYDASVFCIGSIDWLNVGAHA